MKKLLLIIFMVSVAFTLTAADTVKNDNTKTSCCENMDKSKCSKMMKDGKMKMSGHMKTGHMKNMKMSHMKMMKGPMFSGYMSIQRALATDNSVAAKEGFTNLWKNSEGDVKVLAEKGMKAKDLKGMRSYFKDLSGKMAMMKHPEGYATAYCPMAKAWWVQKSGKDISNPCFGKKMPHCGSFKEYKEGGDHQKRHKM